MSHAEFLAWAEFWKVSPFDDYHRFYRPAALVAQVSGGGDVNELLAWLKRETPIEGAFSDADINTFKALGLKPPKKG